MIPMDTSKNRSSSTYRLDPVQVDIKNDVVKQSVDAFEDDLAQGSEEADEIRMYESVSVLVVDEKPLAQTMRTMLQGLGFSVDIVNSGAEALLKALKSVYDLVIIEEDLPDSNGAEVAQVIKKMDERTKTIILTSADYAAKNDDELHKGIDELLVKPFTPNELIQTVRKITEFEQVKEIESIKKWQLISLFETLVNRFHYMC